MVIKIKHLKSTLEFKVSHVMNGEPVVESVSVVGVPLQQKTCDFYAEKFKDEILEAIGEIA